MKEYKTTPYSLESLLQLLKNKEYYIFNVYLNNKIIAGGTMIKNKNSITSHLAASKKEYLKYSPNNFLYYSLIKYAIQNKLDNVNYGPSPEGSKVAKFKLSMGGKPISFEKHIILNKFLYKIIITVAKLLKKIK
ncbi:GNAT family N-acetyltransferase [archaeon]|nr:GNAT family N-acetyltransferase [archaeon]